VGIHRRCYAVDCALHCSETLLIALQDERLVSEVYRFPSQPLFGSSRSAPIPEKHCVTNQITTAEGSDRSGWLGGGVSLFFVSLFLVVSSFLRVPRGDI